MMHGHVSRGFEPVADAFEANFRLRSEVGASFCVYQHGECVVDLWGGYTNKEQTIPWCKETRAVVFSATKGWVAICFLLLQHHQLLDLDEPISKWWPEFAKNGKSQITPRMVLNHRAGLSCVDSPLNLGDFDEVMSEAVVEAVIEQTPHWEPNSNQGYGACSFGVFCAAIFFQITGQTLGAFFRDNWAGPLNAFASIGEPCDEPVATLLPLSLKEAAIKQLIPAVCSPSLDARVYRRVLLKRRTLTSRAFLNPSLGKRRFGAMNEPENLFNRQLPWMNGIATAKGLARVYAPLALDGQFRGKRFVDPHLLPPLHTRQTWSDRDKVLQKPIGWSQGFVKEETGLFSPNPHSFGHPGAGGALGWADPDSGLSIGYVMNKMDHRIRSPRSIALCHAVYDCLGLRP